LLEELDFKQQKLKLVGEKILIFFIVMQRIAFPSSLVIVTQKKSFAKR